MPSSPPSGSRPPPSPRIPRRDIGRSAHGTIRRPLPLGCARRHRLPHAGCRPPRIGVRGYRRRSRTAVRVARASRRSREPASRRRSTASRPAKRTRISRQCRPSTTGSSRAVLSAAPPIVALGGGVVGDLAGFVAATYLRGDPLRRSRPPRSSRWSMPRSAARSASTTRVARTSSARSTRRRLVVEDTSLLASLPQRSLHEGYAEVIKHGLILDPAMLDVLEREADALARHRTSAYDGDRRAQCRDQGARRHRGRARGRPAHHPELRPHRSATRSKPSPATHPSGTERRSAPA